MALGALGPPEPGQPALAVLAGVSGRWPGDAPSGDGPCPAGHKNQGGGHSSAVGLLQPVSDPFCDRGQELCRAGAVGGSGLVVAPFGPSHRLRGGGRAGRTDPLLWIVSGACGRGLGRLAPPLEPCCCCTDRIPPGLGLDGLCRGLSVQLPGRQLDWRAGLRLVGGDLGPRPWSLAPAQVGADSAVTGFSAALGRAAPSALAELGTA